MKAYQISTTNGLIEVQGREVENPWGFDLFIHRNDKWSDWTISEASTGLYLDSGRTQKEAIANVIKRIERVTPEKAREIIAFQLARVGGKA